MSPYKPAHEVSCAHCQQPGADSECQTCRRPMCTRCDILCPEGRVEVHQIGWRKRVMAIDRDGAQVLVAPLLWGRPFLRSLGDRPSDGKAMAGVGRGDVVAFNSDGELERADYPYRREPILCNCARHVIQVHSDETISISPVGGPTRPRSETLRGRVIGPVAYDCGRQLLAVAIRGGIHVFATDVDHRVRKRRTTISSPEEPAAIAFDHGLLAMVTKTASGDHRLRVFRCHAEGVQTLPAFEWKSGRSPMLRARGEPLDNVGERISSVDIAERPILLAIGESGHVALAAERDRVLVAHAESGSVGVLSDHRGRITFVGFAGDRLVTADARGALRLRKAAGDLY